MRPRFALALGPMARFLPSTLLALTLGILLAAPAAHAQVSQMLRAECGGDYQAYKPAGGSCNAGEIDLATVSEVIYENQAQLEAEGCVPGEELVIQTATANFSINTQIRTDLIAWLSYNEGSDPNLPTVPDLNECVAATLPGPFALPFGDADGDDCGDIAAPFQGEVQRTFTNIPIQCQDNNGDGFLDINVLVTWSQQQNNNCSATGFNTGSVSKCDYNAALGNQVIAIQVKPRITLLKAVVTDDGGTAIPQDWTLSAAGPTPLSGVDGDPAVTFVEVDGGDYTLSESGGPSGYTPTGLSCVNDTTGQPVTLTNGDTFTAVGRPIFDSPDDTTPNEPNHYICTFVNDDQPATLTLVKNVVTDNGGTATAADWTLTATGALDVISGVTGDATITNATVAAGDYALTESTVPGYAQLGWVCTGGTQNGASVTLAEGETASCTVTNDDLPTTLTLTKLVFNDNGGNAIDTDFTLAANGPASISGAEGDASVTNAEVPAGTYTLSETPVDGYQLVSWSCSGTGTFTAPDQITLAQGQSASCEATNDDLPVSLTLLKTVENNFGGNDPAGSFPITLTGVDGTHDGGVDYFDGSSPDVEANVQYTVSEVAPDGYSLVSITCSDAGGDVGNPFTLTGGQDVTCTVVNEDQQPSLVVTKEVINDDTGNLQPADFPLLVNGNTVTTGVPVAGVQSNTPYTVSETQQTGYNLVSIICEDSDTGSLVGNPVTLQEGQNVSCVVTNDDQPAGLTLLKDVTNDNGGNASAGDWTLTASGPTVISGTSGVSGTVEAGVYTLSEGNGPDGYAPAATAISCVGATLNGDQLLIDESADLTITCTFFNDDQPADLTLLKNVITDDGGTATAGEWTLNANGPTPLSGASGVTSEVDAGDYTLSESGGPAGYTEGSWSCPGATLVGNVVTVELGQSVSCTIDNDDDPATLTLVKNVINDDGGDAVDTDFTLAASGPTSISGIEGDAAVTAAEVSAGVYTLSETGPDGYTLTGWDCSGGANVGDQLTLANGDDVTCRATNDDDAVGLTIVKDVITDDGGLATPASFNLILTGADGVHDAGIGYASGANPPVVANVAYTLGEDELEGYENVGVVCENDAGPLPYPVTLQPGGSAVCTLTNDDIVPQLTVVKVVDGGTATPADFVLTLTGTDGTHDAGLDYASGDQPPVQANVTYTLSEEPDQVPNYFQAGVACFDDADQSNVPHPVTLTVGRTVTCNLVNRVKPFNPPPPPTFTAVPVPVDQPWALAMLLLTMLGMGWYFTASARSRR